MTRPIVLPKTSAAEAEGRLPKNFGIGRLCSASVILWVQVSFSYSLNQNSRYCIHSALFYKKQSSNFEQFKEKREDFVFETLRNI